MVTVKDADYFGFDLRTVQNVTLDQCGQACKDDDACKAFTYNTKAKWCFLKSDFNTMNPFPGAVAGKIVMEVAERDIGAPGALDFLTEQQVNDAKSMRDGLTVDAGMQGLGVDAIIALAGRDALSGNVDRAMLDLKSALALDPDNIDLWIRMSEMGGRVANNYDINNQGLQAAINAYQLTRTKSVRANALVTMARALEYTQNYRYKASLKLVDNPTVKTAYEELRFRQGFRVVGNTVNSDSATPSACVQFSEPLIKSGVDYTSFVTLDGAAPKALEAKGLVFNAPDLAPFKAALAKTDFYKKARAKFGDEGWSLLQKYAGDIG